MKLNEGEVSTGAVGEDGTWLAARDFDFDDGVSRKSIPDRKLGQYEIDFSDIRAFCVVRWGDVVKATTEKLTASDLQVASNCHDWQGLAGEIQAKLAGSQLNLTTRRQVNKIQPLPRVLATLTTQFSNLVIPSEFNFEILWGLIYLNLKLSYLSFERLQQTTDKLHKIRRKLELLTRVLQGCDDADDANEARIAAVDFLDLLTTILTDSIIHMHEYSSDRNADQNWPVLNEKINSQLRFMEMTIEHVNDIITYRKANLERQFRLSQRYALPAKPDEPDNFPKRSLPVQQNQMFYGRKDELDKIYNHLSPKEDLSLRTYTIYGRRGVGKTEIPTNRRFSKVSDRALATSRGIKGKVKGRDVWAFGDTGAGQNIISARHAEELGLEIHKSPRRLRMGNSKTVFSPGSVNYPWAFSENPDKITSIVAHVLDCFSYDLLLGNPFLKATQTMTKHITRFVKGIFSAHPKWVLNLLGETSDRLEGVLGGSVRMQGLPDIGSSRNMMNEDWAKAHGFPIQSGSENCGRVHFPDGTSVATTGRVHTTITLAGGDAIPIVFEVLPNCYVPVVLGENFVFDNDIFSNYADSLHEVEGLDCSDELLLMDYEQPWYTTVAEKAKLLLRPKLWKKKITKEPQSEKVLNDVMELERQHQWDVKYQYGKAATKIEWDAEHNRRENHELRKYPHWRLGPDQTLISHHPKATVFPSENHDEHPHGYAMFGAEEAALWLAERPTGMT